MDVVGSGPRSEKIRLHRKSCKEIYCEMAITKNDQEQFAAEISKIRSSRRWSRSGGPSSRTR